MKKTGVSLPTASPCSMKSSPISYRKWAKIYYSKECGYVLPPGGLFMFWTLLAFDMCFYYHDVQYVLEYEPKHLDNAS